MNEPNPLFDPIPGPVPDSCDRCPNNRHHRNEGIVVFGQRIDPLEIVTHIMILVFLGIPAGRAALAPEATWHDSAKWAALLFGASTIARLSPTQRIDLYSKVTLPHVP